VDSSQRISERARIAADAYIGDNVTIYGPAIIQSGAVIEDNCIIGKHSTEEIESFRLAVLNNEIAHNPDLYVKQETIIGKGCYIGYGSTIFSGAELSNGVELEEYGRVGANTIIGENTRLMYRALVYNRVRIGNECRISGFICNETVLHNRVSFYGKAVHKYRSYSTTSRSSDSPVLKDGVIVGFDAIIIGGVLINRNAYIAAGCIITRDVPESKRIFGIY